jgi:predicted MFS family arabinose efflux permease
MDARRFAIYTGAFIGPLASNAVLALVPELKASFNAGAPEVLLSITFFMLPFAIFSLFTGAISDVLGRSKVLRLGFLIYAIGCIVTALSPELLTFYLSRAIQGIGFACLQPVLVALLGDIVPGDRKGVAMGLFTGATTAGISLGPLVAGMFSIVDWRLTFWFIAILSFILAFLHNSSREERKAARSDWARLVLSRVGRTLKLPPVVWLSITGFMQVLCYIGNQAFVSTRLSEPPLLITSEGIGAILAVAGLIGLLASRVGGELVVRMGLFKSAGLGFIIMASSLALMLVSDTAFLYTVALAIFAIGSAIAWASQLTLAVEFSPELRGTISSLFTSAGFLGGSLAAVVLSAPYLAYGIAAVNVSCIILCAIMAVTMRMASAGRR